MKINKIILYNFNSFEELNEFDFTSDDPDKNIVLIGGKNGAGKTSLFTAIKIALYGPLAFGYLGVNPHYISKIKDCINLKTFQKNVVESKVQIAISIMVEREIKEYEIIREWKYTKQKLVENYFVRVDGTSLDEQKLSYFQNYLHGIVPPDLFDFFMFDGEAVGSIFSTSSYNSYVRNAVYTLCGLDVFEIIRKYASGYVGKAANENEKILYDRYIELKNTADRLEKKKTEFIEQFATDQEELYQIENDLIDLDTAFRNAGGITEVVKQQLAEEYDEAEHIKTESAAKIKIFVEDLMPFYIIKEFAKNLTEQLEFEEQGEIYNYVQNKLDRKEIEKVLNSKGNISSDVIDSLMELLLGKFKPGTGREDYKSIHDLSKEDVSRINAIILSLDNFNVHGMVDLINQKKIMADRTAEINRILRNAMTDDDAFRFVDNENGLLKKKEELTKQLFETEKQIDIIEKELESVVQQCDKALQILKNNARNKHVFELSSGITRIMNTFLVDKAVSMRKALAARIVSNLQQIYRKDNLITHIEISEDFQFNLYQNAKYSTMELTYLMQNLGREALVSVIGMQSQEKLFELYGVDSLAKLQQVFLKANKEDVVDLYKKIDLGRLSQGERQIFILSLYWAIVELSEQDIPFIIDTPYARIDANHRKVISEIFFPQISKQVIILSTDEEINEEYYKIIKPYIAKEFLLTNDEDQNRTTVEQHYFFGE